jgi:uncharacterized membrane protein
MTKQASNQLLERSSKHEIHPAGETSPVNPKKTSKAKASTTIVIGWILRGGVTLSTAIILTGLLLLFHPGGLSGHVPGSFPSTLEQVWSGILNLQPQAVIALGLLLLIATPVITVTASAVAFAVERDRRYVIISLIVLAILLTSLFIGRGGV